MNGNDLLAQIENENPKLGIYLRNYLIPTIQPRGRAGQVLATPPDAVGNASLRNLSDLVNSSNPPSASYVGTDKSGGIVVAPTPAAGITALTGDVDASGSGSVSATVKGVNGASIPLSEAYLGTNGSGQIIPASAPPSGITQLTGDVTAGPGSGSQAATVVATHLAAPLPVAQGGSGTATPSLVAGTNVIISGAWPNQTVAAASGSSIDLQTDGVDNTDQSKLNLIAGTNVTLAADALGGVTIAASGGGGGGNMSYLGDWSAGAYPVGSVVRASGAIYLCTVAVSSAPPAFVQGAANVNSGTIAFTSDVTAGNLLVIFFGDEGTVDPSTVTDSQGNTWTKITAITGNANNAAMYCATAGLSGACTISFTTGGAWKKATIAEFSGASPTVNTFGSVYGNASPVTVPVTTTVGNCMIFAGLAAFHSAETFGAVAPLTLSAQAAGHDAVVGGYYLATSVSSTNIGFTLSGTGSSPLIAAAFEGAALPPPSDPVHWTAL